MSQELDLEDDIIMSPQQRAELFGSDVMNSRWRRSVRAGKSYRWNLPIRYRITEDFDGRQQRMIRRAIRGWHKTTCIKFLELPSETPYDKPFVVFKMEHDHICTSYVGNQEMKDGQPVLLGSRCFEKFGRLLHELGHVLGLIHEHMRPDRDDYVIIRAPEANINFQKAQKDSLDDYGVPYDFNSVMHYPVLDTDRYQLMPRDDRYIQNIGQRSIISFLDARKINSAYCNNSCSNSRYPPPSCQHGGYRHPTRCYKCICPEGFGGLTCRLPARHQRAKCGGKLELRDDVTHHVIYSPGYDSGLGYKLGTECNWVIQTRQGHRIATEFQGDFFVPSVGSLTCDSWVELKTGLDLSQPGYRFCGENIPLKRYVSEGSELSVVFMSSRHSQGKGYRKRKRLFELHMWMVSS